MKRMSTIILFALFFCSLSMTASATIDDKTLNKFLLLGKWSDSAEDNIHGERLSVDFVREIVERYNENPQDEGAIDDLGLLVLATSVAGWGIENSSLTLEDPAGSAWSGPARVSSGKHLMSYAKGGIGIPHADSGFLEKLVARIESQHPELLDADGRFPAFEGINFDILYANGGACEKPVDVIMTDLAGKEFGHETFAYGGDKYCNNYKNKKPSDKEDWRIFRHVIRAALRERDVQRWIIQRWIKRYWRPSYSRIVEKKGRTVEEALINARIRNSRDDTANCAITRAQDSDDPLQVQLDTYLDPGCKGKKSNNRRTGLMMRPVVLYRYFTTSH